MKTPLLLFFRSRVSIYRALICWCGVLTLLPVLALADARQPSGDAPTLQAAQGRILIKPRLKYELVLSLHVLRCAEDHHQLFTNWAGQMRASLQAATLRQATNLNAIVHEWQLCSLLQNYDGPDTIEGIVQYVRRDAKRECYNWAAARKPVVEKLGVPPRKFSRWYADFLQRYYQEGFGRTWEAEHRRLIQAQAVETAKALDQLPYSILELMENHTGRKFSGPARVIFHPSSFSRPQHAYGFEENGIKAVVYKVSPHPAEAVGSAFHELLHPLLNGWFATERMQTAIRQLARDARFEEDMQPLRGSYQYPEGCLEELIVHALGNYLCVKAGVFDEATARRHSYGPYQNALYDAIFARYHEFGVVDDFILYAITHIQPVESKWGYRQ